MHYFIIFIIATCLVSLCVILHYEALRWLGLTLGAHVHKRIGVLLAMFGLLIAHILEIWIFAIGYILVQHGVELGHIKGIEHGNLIDFVYYSSVVYTTVGFGDLVPIGPIRMLTAAEGLTGLALVTWSASFTFLAMQRFWPHPLASPHKKSGERD
ncbi:MAG TPA: potassium channel family protein [Nitrosomonas sp.]|nr:potassium channel family protein [Nitrosomonas sp.]HQU98198.1 potassium channel family protein [Nitrosomonas sp.]HQX13752.1 potassium channel family protein [Nitrosomonas sp.]HRB21238.1 potassium channel family protein [Nitrosomonas sp.]HRB32431.1 potassium channel family protein [Nitrosomonas sp.]